MPISRRTGIRALTVTIALALSVPLLQPRIAAAQPTITLTKQVMNYTHAATSHFGNTTTANPGDTVEYQIGYTPSATVGNLQISDVLNTSQQRFNGTCFGVATNCGSISGNGAQRVIFNIQRAAAGRTEYVYFRAQIAAGYTFAISNTAYATAFGVGSTASNTTTINPGAPAPPGPKPQPTMTTLTLTKTACPTPSTCSGSATVSPGAAFTYNLAYKNTGSVSATNVHITDTLTNGQIYNSSGSSTICSSSGGPTPVITCNVGTVAAGASGSATIAVNAPNSAQNFTNQATLTADNANPTSSTANVSVVTAPATTLSIVKSVCDTSPGGTCGTNISGKAGDSLQYTIGVQNTGTTTPATNVVMTDTLGAGQTYVSSSAGCTFASSTSTVTCTVGTLAPAATATFTINTTILAPFVGTVTNNASASASNASTVNAIQTTVTVSGPPPAMTTLSLIKSVHDLTNGQSGTNISGSAGDQLQYTLVVQNTGGTNPATNVTVNDTLGAGQTYQSSTSGCTGTPGSSTVTCTIASISPGATATFFITTTISNPFNGTVTNNASATATNAPTVTATQTTVTVSAPPPTTTTLSVSKQVADTSHSTSFGTSVSSLPGDIVTYQITVRNAGSTTANSVNVTDAIQPGQSFYGGSCFYSSCSISGSTITFYNGNLTPGNFATDQFSVTVNATTYGQVIPNTATASASNATTASSNTTSIFVQTPTPVYTPPVFVTPVFGAITVCGLVTTYTPASLSAGTMVIGGETFSLAPGVAVSGVSITVGSSFCVVISLNSTGQIASIVVSVNLPGTSFICGPISLFTSGFYPYTGFNPYPGYNPNAPFSPYPGYGPYPAPATFPAGYYGWGGPMMVGGYPFNVSSNTVFPFQLQNGTSYCFLLTNGAISGSLSVIPTAATAFSAPEYRYRSGRNWAS